MSRRPRARNAPYKRADRVSDAIKREIGMILLQELSDPRLTLATITGVDISGDLKLARVHVSILGTDQARNEGMAGLRSAAGFIRKRLAERLTTDRSPLSSCTSIPVLASTPVVPLVIGPP